MSPRPPDAPLQEELEAGLLLVGEGDLGDQHLDEDGGNGPVQLPDDGADLRPLPAGAAEEEEVPALVDDEAPAGADEAGGGAPAVFRAARGGRPPLSAGAGGRGRSGRGRSGGRAEARLQHPAEGLGDRLGLGVAHLVGEDGLLDRVLAPGVEGPRPVGHVGEDGLVPREHDHLVHPVEGEEDHRAEAADPDAHPIPLGLEHRFEGAGKLAGRA